ncbi:LuxR C-terminal-related transcriptional regulator [Microbacterium sp. CJ88]|uniref:LuxR C-terminal-related transcriptional regulator n=1 Tax=Microbacterium sp. CJ88 TaxID=3445672 RepID=UPI003F655D3D
MRETSTMDAGARAVALADLVHARRGRAWILEGSVGMGVGSLAADVAADLGRRDLDVLAASALPALREVPLGALAPLLARADVTAHADEAVDHRLQRLFARLARGTARTVIVVDDAMWLDEQSAAAIHQLVRAYGVRVILTTRRGWVLADALRRLEDEGLAERVPVLPLDDSAAATLVECLVGDAVAPESLIETVGRGAGNPLFLRLLLDQARQTGQLHPSARGVVIDTPALPPRVAELVAEWTEPVTDAERHALELLAVAGALPRGGFDAASLTALHARGLVALEATTAAIVAPLVAEAIEGALGVDARDERRRQAADLLDPLRDEDRLARALLLSETTAPPPTAEIAWAAHAATVRGAHPDAVRLAERADALAAARGEPPPLEALILRGESLWLLGRHDEADAAFDAALAASNDDAGVALTGSRASQYWAIRRRDPRRATEIEQAALASLTSPDARAFLLGATAKWRIMIGAPHEAPVAGAPVSDSAAATAATALDPHLVATLTGVLAGRTTAARAAIAAGRPFAEAAAPFVRHVGELFDFAELALDALDGDLDRAREAMTARSSRAVSEGAGMWNYGAAFLQYQSGQLDRAVTHATVAVDQLAWRDLIAVLGAAHGLRVAIVAQRGDRAAATTALGAVDPALRTVVLADLQLAEAESWIAYRAGATDPTAPLTRALERAAGTGHDVWLAFAAHAAIRMGVADGALVALSASPSRPEASVVGLILAHGEALAGRDGAQLLRAADAMDAAGLHAGAYDAALQALGVARAAGSTDLARQARVTASRIAVRLSPSPARADAGDVLSAREWSVATAAAARERNREIAERLGLSLRTVENHLASAYRKLGVSGRDELRAALDGGASG